MSIGPVANRCRRNLYRKSRQPLRFWRPYLAGSKVRTRRAKRSVYIRRVVPRLPQPQCCRPRLRRRHHDLRPSSPPRAHSPRPLSMSNSARVSCGGPSRWPLSSRAPLNTKPGEKANLDPGQAGPAEEICIPFSKEERRARRRVSTGSSFAASRRRGGARAALLLPLARPRR
jgi:hypothetical protein